MHLWSSKMHRDLQDLCPPMSAMYEDDVKIRRREHARVAVQLGVTVSSESNFYVGFADNISKGGLFVATHDLLPIGQTLLLQFRLPEQQEPIEVEAVVRWQRTHSDPDNGVLPGFGAQFVDLDDDECARLQDFINSRAPLFHPD